MNVLMWCHANAQMQDKHLGCYTYQQVKLYDIIDIKAQMNHGFLYLDREDI
jgi:hypothetical protein